MKLVFLISLPRSGSTLLQKLLMNHKDILSDQENWILLNLFSFIKDNSSISNLSKASQRSAAKKFIASHNIPKENLYGNLGIAYKNLLSEFVKDDQYFIDKTPRNYFIIDELKAAFPDSKFIFLLRSPASVVNSILNTWTSKRFSNYFGYSFDIDHGFDALGNYLENNKEKNDFIITYEDLTRDTEASMLKIFRFLEINQDKCKDLSNFNKNLRNYSIGDPIKENKDRRVDTNSIESWRKSVNTYFYKKYLYFKILKTNDSYMRFGNYDKQNILNNIKTLKINSLGIFDLIYFSLSFIGSLLGIKVFLKKIKDKDWNYLS